MHTVGWILRVSVATWFPTLRIYIRVLHVVIIQEPGSRSLVSLFWLRSLYVITLQSVTNELWLFRHRLQGVTRELVLWLKRTHRFAVCGKLDSLRFSALNVRVGQVVYRPIDLRSDKCARFCALDIISTHVVWLSLNKIQLKTKLNPCTSPFINVRKGSHSHFVGGTQHILKIVYSCQTFTLL